MANIAINGFGRIGRLVLRAGIDNPDLNFVAVNDLTDADTLAYLFELDSVHGAFEGRVESADGTLRINDREIKVLAEMDPGSLPWDDMDIDLVIEATGRFESKKESAPHIDRAGAKRVMITAPAKDADATIAYGVNDDTYDEEQHKVISIASCTTNALAPVVKMLNNAFGIEAGFINTAHSYTNTQALLDAPMSKKSATRNRAAAVNLVPTTTGAAKAIGDVLPELDGRLDGMAIRTPTPCGSILDLTAILSREVSADEINSAMHEAAGEESYKGVVQIADKPLVSTDIIGNKHSSIVETELTMAKGRLAKVMAWYDNEYGFACRVVDVALMMTSQVRQPAMVV